jgi:hypothetical protein
MKKIIILIIIIVGAYFIIKSATKPSAPISQMSENKTSATKENVITYSDTGYSPSALEITFKNESSQSMWPASAMHPTHRDYPTTGGCLGSTFDACKGIQPGDSWSFKFDIAGNWKYHDHLSPKNFGAIIVK